MTRIYEFRSTSNQEWALPTDDEDFGVFATFDGNSKANNWNPVHMRLLNNDGRGHDFHYSEFPWFGLEAPVMRRRAADALRDFLEPYSELLPLACDEAELFVLNVTTVIDALNVERSKVVRSSIDGRIKLVTKHVFRPEVVSGVHVFKLRQFPKAGKVYVSQDLVDSVRKSALEGIDFRLLWEG